MQYNVKQWLAVLLALMMTFTTLPTAALSESVTPTEATPSAGVPFGEGMLAFDSEEEALAYLWSLEDDEYGIMPIGEVTDQKVDPKYFRFSIYGANESGTPTSSYASFAELQAAHSDVTPTDWDWGVSGKGPDGGDLRTEEGAAVDTTLATYPRIPGYRISSIRVNGTIIYHLGMYEVNGHSYVHFTSITAQGRLTTVVLTNEDYGTAPFEVRYVPEEYTITYQVFEDESDVTTARKNAVFGTDPAGTTVDGWASVDVTIPAGYIGHVYIGNSEGFEDTYYPTYEKYPNESSYGEYALGAEPEYSYTGTGTNTIEIVTGGDTPDSYTLTGTYSVGSNEAKVSADQTVRVVLTKKESITFHAEAWKDYVIGGTDTENKADPSSSDGTVTNDGWTVEKEFTGDSVDFTWTITMKDQYYDGNTSLVEDAELRTLEINGATIPVPFVSTATTSATTTTTLPSGAEVTITANYNSGNPSYTITVTGATRDIWITGGSMNTNESTYKELVISGLYGMDVELWANNSGVGGWTQVAAGDTFCTGYNWGTYEQQTAYEDAGFLYHMTGASGGYTGNVRFKLQDGFTFAGGIENPGGTAANPTVQLVDKTGGVQSSSGGVADVTALTVSGPDSAGWYYVTLPSPYGTTATPSTTMNAYLLEVRAYPEQYVVVYQDGVTGSTGGALNPSITGTVSDMPDYTSYNNRYVDNNSDQYYALAAGDGSYTGGDASDSITVSNATPTITREADERAVTFEGWVLTDAEGHPYEWENSDGRDGITIADKVKTPAVTTSDPSQYPIIAASDLLELRNIMDASTTGFGATGTEYAIYLTALWSTPADRYTYYVTFNYTDETGAEHTRVQATVNATYTAQPFDDGSEGYYIVKRETFFNLAGLDGLSVVYDPDNVKSITGGDLGDSWQWYKYDDRESTKNGSKGDIYKWTGVDNLGEVAVWFISTLGQLTIGKTVTDPFLDETDPADAVRETAEFTFDVEFTLPENDSDTTGNEEEFFGTGGSYTVQYTIDSGGPQEMKLTKGSEGNTYTGTLKLKDGQKATFDLPEGTKYTVKERVFLPGESGVGFKLTEIDNNGGAPITGESQLANGATGSTGAAGTTAVQFTNAPTTGGLTVAKTVQGSEGDTTKEWHFRVDLGQNLTGAYGGMRFTDGVAVFTLRHGASLTATDLPSGTAYAVTEEEADRDGYTTTATGASGTIPGGGTAQAAFTNTIGETPTDNELGDIPKTGDESHPALWFSLMILSLFGITATVLTPIIGRKKIVSTNGKHMRK